MSTEPAAGTRASRLCPRCHAIYAESARFCARDREELVEDSRVFAGKFILLDKIGEGSMGAVFKAEQPQMGRTVAVKILRADLEVMERFEREVQASGSMNHANVVTVFDSGLTDDGRGYIAMEYLEGESLAKHMERHGPMPTAHALELWIQAVRAMSAAHAKGIVHRDLKPDNIFLADPPQDDEGKRTVVKVLDFGIAKFHKRAQQFKGTTPGMIVGTMQYMSPEQLQGAEADPCADVYALGLILVEMLTGRLPWGDTAEQGYSTYALRLVKPALPLQRLRPDQRYSAELQRLVAEVLAEETAPRPQNGGELLQRLKQIPEAQPLLRTDARSSGSLAPEGGASPSQVRSSGARSLGPGGPDGTQVTSRLTVPGAFALPPSLRTYATLAGAAVFGLIAGVYLLTHRASGTGESTGRPDLAPVQAVSKPTLPAQAPERGPDPAEPLAPKTPAHRAPHPAAAPTLHVQFAFTDAGGVQLQCGGKKLGAPDCSAGGLCKLVVSVAAGQKCVAEKGASKKVFSFAELQKNPPDRKNLIHVLVRFQ